MSSYNLIYPHTKRLTHDATVEPARNGDGYRQQATPDYAVTTSGCCAGPRAYARLPEGGQQPLDASHSTGPVRPQREG